MNNSRCVLGEARMRLWEGPCKSRGSDGGGEGAGEEPMGEGSGEGVVWTMEIDLFSSYILPKNKTTNSKQK